MIKTLAKSIRDNKLPSILTLIFIMGEVLIEVMIPSTTAELINNINAGAHITEIIKTGLILIALALVSLACGSIAAITCARASSGFARNLRRDMFERIQSFSFSNIDKFSSTSLVTRLTTDINHVQMSYMMIIRTAIRSPMLFTFSVITAYRMGGALATSFVVVIPVLIFGLLLIAKKAMPAFRRVFKKYDKLNESVQENIKGIRVVKSFVREEFEMKKFGKASDELTLGFTKADTILAFNGPIMQLCMHISTILISYFCSKLVITTNAEVYGIGTLSGMMTYSMQVLMSMMMISFIS